MFDLFPSFPFADIECYTQPGGTDYRGHVSVTVTGKQCQQWTSQSPHKHEYTPENWPNYGLGPHNFCRNPVEAVGPWCYTLDSETRWEYCEIDAKPSCNQGESFYWFVQKRGSETFANCDIF